MQNNNLATKQDLGKVFFHLDSKIDRLENKMDRKFDKVNEQAAENSDKQVKLLVKIEQELASHSKSYQDHEIKLDDHNNRIQKLEFNPVA